MAFQVSPGVQVKEVDLTNVVPAVSSTVGAFAGSFQWGPVDEVVTVSDANGIVESFGEPKDIQSSQEDFFTAESFLKYGSALRLVRINATGLYNANSNNAATKLIKNLGEYENTYEDGSDAASLGAWTARYAGSKGKSLRVSVCATANAYSESAAATVANPASIAYPIDTTDIVVSNHALFSLRDVVTFASHSTRYRVTAITSGSNTLKLARIGTATPGGLVTAVADASAIAREWEFAGLFNKAPGLSAAAKKGGCPDDTVDEMHVVVSDADGSLTGTRFEVLETFGFVSKISDAKGTNGSSNYYRDVIKEQSNWIYWTGHNTGTHSTASIHVTTAAVVGGSTFDSAASVPLVNILTQGSDGEHSTAGQKVQAYKDHFADADSVDVSFLITGSTRTYLGAGTTQDTITDHNSIVNELIAICEGRKDCMVVASPRRTSCVYKTESSATTDIKADFASCTSSSYAVFDSSWTYQYDRFNDKYIWVPGNAHTSGIMVRSDLLRDPWFSPAGFSRGQYLGISKLAYNPSLASRDDLYRLRINPIVTFAGQGTILFGDKTAMSSPSAFDRINVRRLFIVLEKAIAIAAKSQLFEFNDAFTRAQFRAAVEPFLRDVKNRRGLIDFSVICDESNNTDTVIDRNEFVCSIFVKPARSINFITLNFVAARSGVEFEEIYSAV